MVTSRKLEKVLDIRRIVKKGILSGIQCVMCLIHKISNFSILITTFLLPTLFSFGISKHLIGRTQCPDKSSSSVCQSLVATHPQAKSLTIEVWQCSIFEGTKDLKMAWKVSTDNVENFLKKSV